MKYLVLGLLITAAPVRADMRSTLSALDAEQAAKKAQAESANTGQKVQSLEDEVRALAKIVKQMADQQEKQKTCPKPSAQAKKKPTKK